MSIAANHTHPNNIFFMVLPQAFFRIRRRSCPD
jgi:hypothetical protein